MARITLRQLLDHAAEHGYGVPAFNINNMEQGLAIMEAAKQTDSPVIIQASRGARAYAHDLMLAKMMEALEAIYPNIPLCLHQDHGNNVATCLSAIQHGFTSVMMDGSLKEDAKTPGDYDYNAGVTKRVSELAHMVGVSVEGELGVLGSLETGMGDKEDGHGFEGKLSHDMLVTDPDEAAKFVAETKVDALAVAIGTSHGAYKFTRKPTGEVLAMDVIEKIHAKLPNTHIVMHGSSSVPQDLLEMINAIWRRDPRDLRRAGGGDCPRHQAWRAQGEYRHRPAPRRHRCDPQGAGNRQGRVRPAQISEARHRCDAEDLQGAFRAVRHGRQRREDQSHPARRDGQALREGRTRPAHRHG